MFGLKLTKRERVEFRNGIVYIIRNRRAALASFLLRLLDIQKPELYNLFKDMRTVYEETLSAGWLMAKHLVGK